MNATKAKLQPYKDMSKNAKKKKVWIWIFISHKFKIMQKKMNQS